MPPSTDVVALPVTKRFAPPGARAVGELEEDALVTITVYPRTGADSEGFTSTYQLGARLPGQPRFLDDDEFVAAYEARPDDLEAIAAFAASANLQVVESLTGRRAVRLAGAAADVATAFQVELLRYAAPGRTFRGYEGHIYVPRDLADVIDGILGLDDRDVGQACVRRAAGMPRYPAGPQPLLPPGVQLPSRLADVYNFPDGWDGRDQTVAILAFNAPTGRGGYSSEALRRFFADVLDQPVPAIADVVVHGQGNDPSSDAGVDVADSTAQIMLDIQVVGALAPGARIAVYFTQFTEQGWVDAVEAIVADTANRPTVACIGYGVPEDDPSEPWSAMGLRRLDAALDAAAARGITVVAGSGDHGVRDREGGYRAHADIPSSNPHVLGCGGTRLIAASEVAWGSGPGYGTGGGVSRVYPPPSWQTGIGVPPAANSRRRAGRGVPDVSAVADPETGVAVVDSDGRELTVVGGAGLPAAIWSALIARINEALGTRLGFLNPLLYERLALGVLRDVQMGASGAYAATPGWDPCTGFGSPDGAMLLEALQNLAMARPATASSPFVEACGRLAESLAAAAAPTDREDLGSYMEAARDAFREYIQSVKVAWTELDSERLTPRAVTEIGHTLVFAAGLAPAAVADVPSDGTTPARVGDVGAADEGAPSTEAHAAWTATPFDVASLPAGEDAPGPTGGP
jgi:kumamolisin